MDRTDIASLGINKLIQQLTQDIEFYHASSVVGVGDDAALIEPLAPKTVLSTKLFIENIHFDLVYTPLKHLGYKCVVAAISGIYAMNAEPTHLLVSLGVSNRFSVEAIEEFYAGIYLACKNYQIDIVGGDTTSSQKGFIISLTAIGECSNECVLRNTAQAGDLIAVTGDLGAPFIGFTFLEREKKIFLEHPEVQPDLENQSFVIGKFLKPEFPKDILSYLKEQHLVPTSMTDISNGLSMDIIRLCQQSKKGCMIYEEKLPIEEDTRLAAYTFKIDPTMCALSGGEEYQLLFTFSPQDYEKIKSYTDIHIIGYMTDEQDKYTITTKGKSIHPLQPLNAAKQASSTEV